MKKAPAAKKAAKKPRAIRPTLKAAPRSRPKATCIDERFFSEARKIAFHSWFVLPNGRFANVILKPVEGTRKKRYHLVCGTGTVIVFVVERAPWSSTRSADRLLGAEAGADPTWTVEDIRPATYEDWAKVWNG